MPQETMPNKPLSGVELKQIILADMGNVLDQDTMLTSHIAYGQVSYSITVKIMTGNPIIPNWTNKVNSRKSTAHQVNENEVLAAVETFPLQLAEGATPMNTGFEQVRQIISPNQSRIENGLAVPITIRGTDGDSQEIKVNYESDMLPDDGGFPDSVTIRELTEAEITKVDN